MRGHQAFALLLLSTVACASARVLGGGNCRERADAAYRECVGPTFYPTGDAERVTTSDQQQACRQQQQSALDECDRREGKTKSSTISGPFNF